MGASITTLLLFLACLVHGHVAQHFARETQKCSSSAASGHALLGTLLSRDSVNKALVKEQHFSKSAGELELNSSGLLRHLMRTTVSMTGSIAKSNQELAHALTEEPHSEGCVTELQSTRQRLNDVKQQVVELARKLNATEDAIQILREKEQDELEKLRQLEGARDKEISKCHAEKDHATELRATLEGELHAVEDEISKWQSHPSLTQVPVSLFEAAKEVASSRVWPTISTAQSQAQHARDAAKALALCMGVPKLQLMQKNKNFVSVSPCDTISQALANRDNYCSFPSRIEGKYVQPSMLALGCPDTPRNGATCPNIVYGSGNDGTTMCNGGPCWRCLVTRQVSDFMESDACLEPPTTTTTTTLETIEVVSGSPCDTIRQALANRDNYCSFPSRIEGKYVQPSMLALGCPDTPRNGATCPNIVYGSGNDGTTMCNGGPCWRCLTTSQISDFIESSACLEPPTTTTTTTLETLPPTTTEAVNLPGTTEAVALPETLPPSTTEAADLPETLPPSTTDAVDISETLGPITTLPPRVTTAQALGAMSSPGPERHARGVFPPPTSENEDSAADTDHCQQAQEEFDSASADARTELEWAMEELDDIIDSSACEDSAHQEWHNARGPLLDEADETTTRIDTKLKELSEVRPEVQDARATVENLKAVLEEQRSLCLTDLPETEYALEELEDAVTALERCASKAAGEIEH